MESLTESTLSLQQIQVPSLVRELDPASMCHDHTHTHTHTKLECDMAIKWNATQQ